MKKSILTAGLLAGALLSASANAQENTAPQAASAGEQVTACTKDNQTATLAFEALGTVGDKPVRDILAESFRATAQELDGTAMTGAEGAKAFYTRVSAALHAGPRSPDARFSITANPTVGAPACKP